MFLDHSRISKFVSSERGVLTRFLIPNPTANLSVINRLLIINGTWLMAQGSPAKATRAATGGGGGGPGAPAGSLEP